MDVFGGISSEYANYDTAQVLLQSIPYDGTSTWGKGADKGFGLFIDASENMELYDIETDAMVFEKGIHVVPQIDISGSPEDVYLRIYNSTKKLLESGKFLTFFGGEHSVSIGIIKAFYEKYPDVTVLHLDAHTDLRPEYMGTPYNHACALYDASLNTNLIQVGIRSMDISEKPFLNPEKCFFGHTLHENDLWMDRAIELMSDNVYITFDLDGLDPAIMPATGTPEPGGLQWYQTLKFLKKVFADKNVLGFDLVEFAPIENLSHPAFLTAKLYYKMLSYKYFL